MKFKGSKVLGCPVRVQSTSPVLKWCIEMNQLILISFIIN